MFAAGINPQAQIFCYFLSFNYVDCESYIIRVMEPKFVNNSSKINLIYIIVYVCAMRVCVSVSVSVCVCVYI